MLAACSLAALLVAAMVVVGLVVVVRRQRAHLGRLERRVALLELDSVTTIVVESEPHKAPLPRELLN